MFFKASLDKLAKTLPILLIGFTLAVFLIIFFLIHEPIRFVVLYPILVLVGVSVVTYIFSPLGYEVMDDRIEIKRRVKPFVIKRSEIESIHALSKEDMGMAWRMAGNGGMFGYTGYFKSKSQGSMRWFVSQRRNYVLLTLKKRGKIVLSPDDVPGFIASTLS